MNRIYTILASAAAITAMVALAFGSGLGGARTAHAAGPVLAGYDLLETNSAETFLDFSGKPLPAGFFGAGCSSFTGTIHFNGVPFDTFGSNTGLSPTDTIVQRLATATTFPASIPIKIVKLSLSGIENISVTCNSVKEMWNIKAEVPEGDPNQPNGKMTIRHEFLDCGTFDVSLPVKAQLTLTHKGGPGLIVISTFSSPLQTFTSTGNIWCDNVSDPLYYPPNDKVVRNPNLPTTNFFPGAENGPNGTIKHLTIEQAAFARHGVRPAERPVPGPIGGVSLDPGAGALPLQSQPSAGGDAWLLAWLMAASVAAAFALGSAAWYARRRRVR